MAIGRLQRGAVTEPEPGTLLKSSWSSSSTSDSESSGADYVLAAAVVPGALTVVLDRAPVGVVSGQGYLVIDPWTTEAELKIPASVADSTVTLHQATTFSSRKVQFVAASKKIRLGRAISSISASAGTVTVVTDTAHQLTTGDTVYVYGTAGHDTGRNTSVTITVTNTTTFTYTAATTGTESTGGVISVTNAWLLKKMVPGGALIVSGTTSNNGTFTVATSGDADIFGREIVVNETVVNEDSTTAVGKTGANFAHAAGDRVLWLNKPLVSSPLWGVRGNGLEAQATANTLGLNRLSVFVYQALTGAASAGGHVVAGVDLQGDIWIDNEVFPERDQLWGGENIQTTRLNAATTFPFTTTGEVCMLHPRRDGQPTIFDHPGPSGRWPIRNLQINGRNRTNSCGFLGSPQQPDAIENIRLEDCTGSYGMALTDVQQCVVRNAMFIGCQVGLRMRSVQFGYFYDCNFEQGLASGSGLLVETHANFSTASGKLIFHGSHNENTEAGHITWDIRSGGHYLWIQAFHTNGANTTLWKFSEQTGTAPPDSTNAPVYEILDPKWSSQSLTAVIVDDDFYRSTILTAGVNKRTTWHRIVGQGHTIGTGDNTAGDTSDMFLGLDGRYLSIGQPSYGTLAMIRARAFAANERFVRFDNASDTEVFAVDIDGDTTIGGALNHDGTTVGLFGVAPATRPTAYTQTYATADKTHAAFTSADLATTATTQTTPYGFSTQAQGDNIATQLNLLRADLADVKQLLNSVIDDLQTLGVLQ